jgi:hypothetical protein
MTLLSKCHSGQAALSHIQRIPVLPFLPSLSSLNVLLYASTALLLLQEQVQNIVGAVLDVLSDAAQQALVRAQAPKTGTGVSTRRCVNAHNCGSVAFA